MKIYQMIHFPLRGAGAGVYAAHVARFLLDRGHDVRALWADHHPPSTEFPGEPVLFHTSGSTRFDLDFDFPSFRSHPYSRGATFGDLTPTQRQAYSRAFGQKIEVGMAEFRPDVVHVHHGWVVASILAEMGARYVVTLHGTELHGFQAFPAYREAALKGIAGASAVMAFDETGRQEAITTYGIAPERVAIVRSGVDTSKFAPAAINKQEVLARLGVRHVDQPIVLFAGRLIELKGVDTLVRAARIYSRGPRRPITLIAGEGDLRPSLEALARDLELDTVQFLGQQDHDRMGTLYNLADVVAVPSRIDTFPLVPLEALACGTPVVASRVGGLSQIVNDRVGRLVDADDVSSLARSIGDLLHQDFKARARESLAAYAQREFSFESTVDQIEGVYRRCVDPSREGADARGMRGEIAFPTD